MVIPTYRDVLNSEALGGNEDHTRSNDANNRDIIRPQSSNPRLIDVGRKDALRLGSSDASDATYDGCVKGGVGGGGVDGGGWGVAARVRRFWTVVNSPAANENHRRIEKILYGIRTRHTSGLNTGRLVQGSW